MLGETFFSTGYELVKATHFDRVAKLIIERLAPQIGAAEVMLLDFAADCSVVRIHGPGAIAESLREDLDGVKAWIRAHDRQGPGDPPSLAGGPTGEGLAKMPDVAGWLEQIGYADVLGSSLIRGRFRSASITALKKDAPFDANERERIQAAILVSHSVLARLINDNYERRVLERLMHSRHESRNAVFVVRGTRVIPYNPGAVGYSEAVWEKDEVDHQLAPEIVSMLVEAVTLAWSSPVDPQWTDVDLDIGGGEIRVGVIARPDEDILLFFAPPPLQAPTGNVPMLTRRQCDIMDWIAEGKTSAEVAIILEISPRTVEKHLEAVFQRFGVENRVAAVRTYLEAKSGLTIPHHAA